MNGEINVLEQQLGAAGKGEVLEADQVESESCAYAT
jgi:hypothetical protein